MNLEHVKYEENRTPYKVEKEKILTLQTTGMSQIEKFNKRYGIK